MQQSDAALRSRFIALATTRECGRGARVYALAFAPGNASGGGSQSRFCGCDHRTGYGSLFCGSSKPTKFLGKRRRCEHCAAWRAGAGAWAAVSESAVGAAFTI